MDLDAIEFTRKIGTEKIIGVKNDVNLLNYWQWAYSDLIGNTERGSLAEYIVSLACENDNEIRVNWDAYDLELKNGIKVEVKSSAYLQTWKQKKYTKPLFGINKTKAWNYIENVYDDETKRQADIYVFALLAHKDKSSVNPLDINQWEFYVLSTEKLNKVMGDCKTISLDKIIDLGAEKILFNDLLDKINREYSKR